MTLRHFLFVLPIVFLLPSCDSSHDGSSRPEHPSGDYTYEVPQDRGDGWTTDSIDSVGMDEALLIEMMRRRVGGNFEHVHGILIARRGRLVLEEYFPGRAYDGSYTRFDWNVRHYLASCTKSVTSTLVGIAFERGELDDLDETLDLFFPEYPDIDWSDEKARIRLRHVLTMSAGLNWDEWSYPYTDSRNMHVQMNNSPDPIAFVLGLNMAAEPGERFVYNSGLSIVLGGILRNRTGMYADEYAQEFLFEPLGIQDVYWWRYPNQTVQAGGGLWMRPRDMAKLGQLHLQNGIWDDIQLVSEDWVQEATSALISSSQTVRYGYQWWIEDFWDGAQNVPSFSARGWGGQYIMVFPDLELVVVLTGGDYEGNTDAVLRTLLTQYILPAANDD